MANYAIVFGNYVSNVIVAKSKDIALSVTNADDAIETEGNPWIGWYFDNGVWINPDALEADDESSTEL
jgi:hypothetical protein